MTSSRDAFVACAQGEHVCVILVERRALPLLQVASSARKIYQVSVVQPCVHI
jgi:hypothetical protein